MSSRADSKSGSRRNFKKGGWGCDLGVGSARDLRVRTWGVGAPVSHPPRPRAPPHDATTLHAGIDLDEARRKREDNIVQLRKDRRDENLQKKRMVSTVAVQTGELETTRSTPSGVQQRVRGRGEPASCTGVRDVFMCEGECQVCGSACGTA